MSTDVLIDDFPYAVKIAQQRTVVLMLMPCWGEKANQIIDLSWATEYRNREWSRYFRFGISQTHFTLCSSLTFPSLVDRMKFSDSIMEMLGVCATTVHRVGLQTAPNELCPRVPLMAWITCAFTIQAIGTVRIGFVPLIPFYHFHFPNLFSCHGRKHTAGRGKTPLWVLAEQTGGKLQVKVCYKKHFCLCLCISEATLRFSWQVWKPSSSSQLSRGWSALRLLFRATSARCWQVCGWWRPYLRALCVIWALVRHEHSFLSNISRLEITPAPIFHLFPQSCCQSFAESTLLLFWT